MTALNQNQTYVWTVVLGFELRTSGVDILFFMLQQTLSDAGSFAWTKTDWNLVPMGAAASEQSCWMLHWKHILA